jgi:hypothetical protein
MLKTLKKALFGAFLMSVFWDSVLTIMFTSEEDE